MIRIVEEKNYRGSIRFVEYIDRKQSRVIEIESIKKLYGNKNFFLLFDSKGEVIQEAFQYLNCGSFKTDNSKEQAMIAIKLLYSYLEIFKCEINKLNNIDIGRLSNFLLGKSWGGSNISIELINKRSNNTHNIYFSQIRNYIKALKIESSILFEKRNIAIATIDRGMFSHTKPVIISRYSYSKSCFSIKNKYLPKYIKKEEFKKLLNNLDTNNESIFDLRSKIILELMYLRGLRIGEVLGLTIEDIILEDNSIILRNRNSDQKYQRAKGLPTLQNIGLELDENEYSKIYISDFIGRQIQKYIEESRNVLKVSEKVFSNIFNYAIADSLDSNQKNFYLFLNKNGYPLSTSGWNKILKNIFIENNISLDKKIKFRNLNHRFRHGFAMYLKKEKKMDLEGRRRNLRHLSISSTLVYDSPEREEIEEAEINLQNEMKKELNLNE